MLAHTIHCTLYMNLTIDKTLSPHNALSQVKKQSSENLLLMSYLTKELMLLICYFTKQTMISHKS